MLGGEDRLLLLLAPLHGVPVLVSVVDQLLHHFGMHSVRHVEEIISITDLAFRVRVWEELGHLRQLDQVVVEALDRELIVLGHRDEVDLEELEDALLADEDVPDHVLGQHVVGHQVILKITAW